MSVPSVAAFMRLPFAVTTVAHPPTPPSSSSFSLSAPARTYALLFAPPPLAILPLSSSVHLLALLSVMHDCTTILTTVLGTRELIAISYSFTISIMRTSTVARYSTRIHARIISGVPLQDHRGGIFPYQPARWHQPIAIKTSFIEPLEQELLTDVQYRGISRKTHYI